jgi:hypothetical protein
MKTKDETERKLQSTIVNSIIDIKQKSFVEFSDVYGFIQSCYSSIQTPRRKFVDSVVLESFVERASTAISTFLKPPVDDVSEFKPLSRRSVGDAKGDTDSVADTSPQWMDDEIDEPNEKVDGVSRTRMTKRRKLTSDGSNSAVGAHGRRRHQQIGDAIANPSVNLLGGNVDGKASAGPGMNTHKRVHTERMEQLHALFRKKLTVAQMLIMISRDGIDLDEVQKRADVKISRLQPHEVDNEYDEFMDLLRLMGVNAHGVELFRSTTNFIRCIGNTPQWIRPHELLVSPTVSYFSSWLHAHLNTLRVTDVSSLPTKSALSMNNNMIRQSRWYFIAMHNRKKQSNA